MILSKNFLIFGRDKLEPLHIEDILTKIRFFAVRQRFRSQVSYKMGHLKFDA